MAREQTLLERMAAAHARRSTTRYAPTTEENLDELMESVRRQLVRLLNARHGMSESAPDYGLPALGELLAGSDDYLRQVQDAIRATIEKYEPRLRRVRVTHRAEEGDHQTLVFRIDGVLVGRSGEHRVWYQTSFAPTGELMVSA